MGRTKENRLIARDGGGREGRGGGGGGVEHVFDVAFLMPVQMSGNTWMGGGGVGLRSGAPLQLCCERAVSRRRAWGEGRNG